MSANNQMEGNSLHDDYAVSQVPMDKRRSLIQTSFVWVGWCVSISAFLAGGIIGGGTTAATGLWAVLLGNLFLVLVASLIGLIGFRTGLSTFMISRIIFGKFGSVITSLLLGILAMGFIGVLLRQFGMGITKLIPSIPLWAAILGFTACVTLTAIYGFKGLTAISLIAAPALWILVTLALVLTIKQSGGIGPIFSAQPDAPISFSTAMGAAIATWVTGAALASDVTRYAKKKSHVVIGALCGYVAGAALFEGASILSAIGVGNPDVVGVLQSLGLLIPGLLILGLALWTTTDNNIYSTALAFTSVAQILNIKLGKTTWVLIASAIALVTAISGIVTQFLVWLQLIGTFIPPFLGIVIAHFWILHRGKNEFEVPENFRLSAFITWLIAIFIAKYSSFDIPAIVGIVSSVIIYPIIGKIMDKNVSISTEKTKSLEV